MDATPHAAGVAFRVWSPHAESVYVTGSFNAWSADANPMAKEDGDYWYPGRVTIVEDLRNDDRITKPVDQWAQGSRLNGARGLSIPCGPRSLRRATVASAVFHGWSSTHD